MTRVALTALMIGICAIGGVIRRSILTQGHEICGMNGLDNGRGSLNQHTSMETQSSTDSTAAIKPIPNRVIVYIRVHANTPVIKGPPSTRAAVYYDGSGSFEYFYFKQTDGIGNTIGSDSNALGSRTITVCSESSCICRVGSRPSGICLVPRCSHTCISSVGLGPGCIGICVNRGSLA